MINKVYVVCRYLDYEGYDEPEVIFSNFEDAKRYVNKKYKDLKPTETVNFYKNGSDGVVIKELPVYKSWSNYKDNE